jgi:hypothetical protein
VVKKGNSDNPAVVPIRRRWEAVVSLIANGTHNTTKFVFESITKGRSNAPST